MARTLQTLFGCALTAALVGCGGAASEPASNPMFERWCHANPCAWDVEGEVKRVGTWHSDDSAAELVSDDASLSQLRAGLDEARARCFAFSMMALVEAPGSALLELDFLDDGEVEFSESIPKSDWEIRTFRIATPTWYEGVRFTIRKTAPGRVILAELNVVLDQRCGGVPLALDDRPPGARCENDSQCISGRCPILAAGGTCD